MLCGVVLHIHVSIYLEVSIVPHGSVARLLAMTMKTMIPNQMRDHPFYRLRITGQSANPLYILQLAMLQHKELR